MNELQLEITPAASKKVSEFFQGKKVKPIRIHLNNGFCISSGLSISIEEPEKGEVAFEIDGYTYYIDQELIDQAAPIKLDFGSTGFKFLSKIDLGLQCPGCGEEGAFCSKI